MTNGPLLKFVFLLSIFGLTSLCLQTTPAYAFDGKTLYNPSSCATDPHGMVYFALGRRVYRQPMENIFYMVSYIPKSNFHQQTPGELPGDAYKDPADLPQPPRPDEPLGCPDNPIQQLGYSMVRFSDVSPDPLKPLPAIFDKIPVSIAENPGIGLTFGGTADAMCKSHPLRDMSIPGLIGCEKEYDGDRGTVYESTDYKVPNGRGLILACLFHSSISHPINAIPDLCQAGYKLYDDVSLTYKFSSKVVPLAQISDFDRELRRRIEVAEIKNYPWRDKP